MSGQSFECFQAETVDQARTLLDNHPDAEILAAGQSLMPELNDDPAEPKTVIDISGIDAMKGITVDGDVAHIGALTTYSTVEKTNTLWDRAQELAEAASKTADPQIRNCATLGGNLVTRYPVSDLSAALIASDATVVIAGRNGERRIDSETLLTRLGAADIARDELLVRIEVPLTGDVAGGAYEKTRSAVSRYTLLGVAARLEIDDGTVSAAGVAANGVLDTGVSLDPVEDAIVGEPLTDTTIERAARLATDNLDESALRDDSNASAAYRAQLLPVHVTRALRRATERAGVTL